ncbi:MAG: hypothetical protein HYS05_04905, partial [Acidobacteria bacterium]|nr:hypothetical protein [Acidobacteriota bacterium]
SQFFTLRRVARTGWDFFALWLKLVVWRRLAPGRAAERKRAVAACSHGGDDGAHAPLHIAAAGRRTFEEAPQRRPICGVNDANHRPT